MSLPSGRKREWLYPHLVPPVLALILALPCVGLGFAWDDFDFLVGAQRFSFGKLAPDYRIIFYRPVSRQVFFGLISILGSQRALIAHVESAALLCGSVYLFVRLAKEWIDERAGFVAGLVLASVGAVPLLVAWTSGIQDLLAIFFTLAALLLLLRGSVGWAPATFGAALLSKETVIATLPAFLLIGFTRTGNWRQGIFRMMPFLLIVAVWAALHPGLRILATRNFQRGPEGYVGFGNRNVLLDTARGTFTFLNLPLGSEVWLGSRIWIALIAAGCLLVLLRWAIPIPAPIVVREQDTRWPLLCSGLLFLGPLCLASTIAAHWEPYYTCMPALGGALMAGILSRRVTGRVLDFALSGFLAMGILWRGMPLETGVISEPHLREVNESLRRVEAGFKQLRPDFPRNTTAYVSIGAVGSAGVYAHMYRFQALRVWYWDPTLATLKPESHNSHGYEALFRVTPDLRVAELFPKENRCVSHEGPIPLTEYQRAARAYARGLAASGESSDAADILLRMPTRNPQDANYNRRMAAMLLLENDKRHDAEQILEQTQPMSRGIALANLGRMLTTTDPKSLDIESGLVAFGLRGDDIEALTGLMSYMYQAGYLDQADVIARRILELNPTDHWALQVHQRFAVRPKPDITQAAE